MVLPDGSGDPLRSFVSFTRALKLDRTFTNGLTSIWRGKTFNREKGVLINRVTATGEERFPAKMFCGESLFDQGSSILLDYANASELSNYIGVIDWLVTDKGLNILDEIRMVRPGLYLGRAHIQGHFVLNFILQQDLAEQTLDWSDDCP